MRACCISLELIPPMKSCKSYHILYSMNLFLSMVKLGISKVSKKG